MKIEVVFLNVTPYHSSQPGAARVNLDGQFVSGKAGFPCIRTRQMPVISKQRDSDEVAQAQVCADHAGQQSPPRTA